MQDNFNQKKIEISFRKFSDYASDLLSSDINTFDTRFKIFLHHCETDEILKIITNQLKDIDVNIDEWWEKGNQTAGGMVGNARFDLPLDETKRDALLYQFSLKILNKEMDLNHFCMMFLGKTNYSQMVYAFNEAIINPLIRSIGYKIDEISYEVNSTYDEYQDIPLKVFYVYQDNSTNISGDVKIRGDGVIGDGSKIEKN